MKRTRTTADRLRDPRPIAGGAPDDERSTRQLKRAVRTLQLEGEEIADEVQAGRASREDRERLAEITEERGYLNSIIAEREGTVEGNRPPVHGWRVADSQDAPLPPGAFTDEVARSDGYDAWMESEGKQAQTIRTPSALRAAGFGAIYDEQPQEAIGARTAARAPITGGDDSAGDLVRPGWEGLLEPGLTRELTLANLLRRVPMDSDVTTWVRELSRSGGAAIVPEATQFEHEGDEQATKPEMAFVFKQETVKAHTIAVWSGATKRILDDARQLRAYIEGELRKNVQLGGEDEAVSGSGGDNNFHGILEVPGTIPVGPPDAGESIFHVTRRAKTQVKKQAKTLPNAVVLSLEDSERVDLIEINAEPNHFASGGPFESGRGTLWRMPRVESEAVPEGTAIVGNFFYAVLFDRAQATTSIGTVGADHIRNIVRMLVEARAGFLVQRPAAFAIVDLGTVGP